MTERAHPAERLISLAAGVLPEFTPSEQAAAAVASGWPAVGIWVDPATWTHRTAREVRARLADSTVTVLDVEVIWIRPGGDDPDHRRIIDAGAAIGARNVLVVSSEPDRRAAASRFAALADHAAAAGLRASLEFGAFTAIADLASALEVLNWAERPDAGLLIDPLHLARTGGRPEDLAGLDPRRFAYAQFCDAPAAGPAASDVEAIVREALDGRLPPGQGELPLGALLRVLPPGTPLSVELRSAPLRAGYPDPAARARALLELTRTALADMET